MGPSGSRRGRLALCLRDLSAGAAFGGMAISDQLPLVVLGLFAVALGVALLGRRPFARAPAVGAALLVLAAAVIGLFVLRAGLDPVIGACAFAALLSANRMLAGPTPTASRQVHLASLLMVSGGAALSGELLFGALLLLFTGLAVLSLTLMVVEEASDDAERVPQGAVLRTAGLGVAAVALGGVALFVFLPRMSWDVASRRVSPGSGSPTTGFSDRVGLGGDGSLKRDLRVVMRVRLDPDPGQEALDAYWVGRRYLDFDGRDWRNHEQFGPPELKLTLAPGGPHTVLNLVELTQAFGGRTLIALDRPILFGGAVATRPSGSDRVQLVRAPSGEVRFAQAGVTYSYLAYSLPQPDTALSSDDRARALALPHTLDGRVSALAQSLSAKARTPAQIATALEAGLRRNYRYTLDLGGDQADPLADFLFQRRAGHCEHFATALAILLRTRGIPSRVVSGFYGGDRVDGTYVLRGGDAHAWTEAWVDGRWLRLDATPPESRSAQASVWAARLARAWDEIDAFWRTRVLDYSARDQLTAMKELTGHRHRGGPTPSHSWPLLRALLGLALGALGLFALGSLFRERPAPRHIREARRLRAQAEKLLAQHALAPEIPDALEEWSQTLARRHHPGAPALAAITRRYLEARFGARALRPGERRALLRSLERTLERPARAA
jgi:hypothetical protein